MNKANIISVSGGKDSTALLLLAKELNVPNLQAVFAGTGNEHPLTYEYIHYLAHVTATPIRLVKADFSQDMQRKVNYINTKWREQGVADEICDWVITLLKPTGNPFLDLCMMKGIFPSAKARFCTVELKRNPMFEQVYIPLLDQGISVDAWQGVRADESRKRALLPERDLVGAFKNGAEHWNYRPLLKWSVEQVFAQHKKHNIKPNPLYSVGMGRVGCMPCIFCRKNELLHIAARFPEQIERIAQWEAILSEISKRGKMTFFSTTKGRGDGIWQCVEWSKTARGGKQLDLVSIEDSQKACYSIYGLCE